MCFHDVLCGTLMKDNANNSLLLCGIAWEPILAETIIVFPSISCFLIFWGWKRGLEVVTRLAGGGALRCDQIWGHGELWRPDSGAGTLRQTICLLLQQEICFLLQ